MTTIGRMIATIAEQVRRLRRRWRRRRSIRRARLAFEMRMARARGAGSRMTFWSTSPGGSDVYARPLTADEWRTNVRPPTTAPRWIPSAGDRAAARRRWTGA
jgi:hypothetical protein